MKTRMDSIFFFNKEKIVELFTVGEIKMKAVVKRTTPTEHTPWNLKGKNCTTKVNI